MAHARQLWLTSADMRLLTAAVRVLVNKVGLWLPLLPTLWPRYDQLYGHSMTRMTRMTHMTHAVEWAQNVLGDAVSGRGARFRYSIVCYGSLYRVCYRVSIES